MDATRILHTARAAAVTTKERPARAAITLFILAVLATSTTITTLALVLTLGTSH
jgi:hypothetical protein